MISQHRERENTNVENTDALRGFQRVQTTHIYVLYFHPRSAEYCKVCHLCYWQFMFAAFWWGPTLCLLVEVNAFFFDEQLCFTSNDCQKFWPTHSYYILHYVAIAIINSIWTQAASITVRIVTQRDVLSAWRDRFDVWQRALSFCMEKPGRTFG